ncbi:hypothetical protein GUITHDRAFT_144939 [Guillardia theta CCMP2712]|uniref:Uncharacterized protein n=1 Tax=Guillardia theta (strain CCMP2712) TaxID=905079 RepID=L1INW2_GUITC|nr:hypothetical protein GUITHDRAFT_144939 [Guillardia theta CCMP2712]EKX37505.1 hypothetical protein GUITHDRAFT_144939 [Guillardia theta CCMP2712]|eukprot:XP_005824485.1 hypothetical protein GUITHDRAFT_144939 [Guillardia theta CCMP2712]
MLLLLLSSPQLLVLVLVLVLFYFQELSAASAYQDYHLKAAYEHQQVSSQASPTAAVDVQVKELRLKNEKLLETEKMMEHYVDSLHEQEEKLREHLNQEVEQLTRKVEQEEKLREEEERRREEVERERDQLAMKLAEVKRESERLKSGDDTSTGRAEIGQHAKENKVLSSSIQEELDTLRSENAKLLKEMQNLNYLLDLSQKTEGDKIHQIEMRNEQLEKKLQDTIQELESLKLISKENQKLAEKMINSPKEDKSPDPRCWS